MKKQYEAVVVYKPELISEEKELTRKLTDTLTKEGALEVTVESWGKKRLSYPIAKQSEGFYLFATFGGIRADGIKKITNAFGADDRIIRHMIVKKA